MKTLQTTLTLTQPNCHRATISLKDVCYSLKRDGDSTYFHKFLCSAKFLKSLPCPFLYHQAQGSLQN